MNPKQWASSSTEPITVSLSPRETNVYRIVDPEDAWEKINSYRVDVTIERRMHERWKRAMTAFKNVQDEMWEAVENARKEVREADNEPPPW